MKFLLWPLNVLSLNIDLSHSIDCRILHIYLPNLLFLNLYNQIFILMSSLSNAKECKI